MLLPLSGRVGTRIADFRLVSLLGRGGSAEVCLAERIESFRQRVASKLFDVDDPAATREHAQARGARSSRDPQVDRQRASSQRTSPDAMLDLKRALDKLEAIDTRKAHVPYPRFVLGLTMEEGGGCARGLADDGIAT